MGHLPHQGVSVQSEPGYLTAVRTAAEQVRTTRGAAVSVAVPCGFVLELLDMVLEGVVVPADELQAYDAAIDASLPTEAVALRMELRQARSDVLSLTGQVQRLIRERDSAEAEVARLKREVAA